MTDHIPVPAEHSPRKEQYVNKDGEVTVREEQSATAWITIDEDSTLEVRQ